MLAAQRKRRRNKTGRNLHERRFHRSPSIERLEDRHLLSGSNLFAQYNGLLDPANDVEHLDLTVAPQALSLMRGRAYLGFHLQAREGNRFDPGVVNIYREDGTAVPPTFARSDLRPTTDSYSMALLEAGNYRVDTYFIRSRPWATSTATTRSTATISRPSAVCTARGQGRRNTL